MMEKEGELTWRDHAVAYGVGAAVALLSWFSGNNAEIPPDLWEEVAVAIGLRPPETIFPCLWRCFTSLLVNCIGLENALVALRILGAVSLGLITGMTFRTFDEILPETLRMRMRRKGWSRRIVRFILLQGAIFFACSDPVWHAGQVFSPTMLLLALTLVAIRMFLHALRTLNQRYAIAMSAVLGLLTAETPFGLLPMIAFPLVVIWRIGKFTTDDEPMSNPLVRVITFRRMSLAFIGGWLAMLVTTTIFFRMHDGLAAHDWNSFTYYVHYLHHYVELVIGAATPVGWIFIFGLVVFPLVMSSVLIRKATDDDSFLMYLHGLFFVWAGLLAFLQSAGWQPFWFWTWTGTQSAVGSKYLLCLCLLATSMTAMISLCVVGVEIYFRNYRRIAMIRYQDAVEDLPEAERMVKNFRFIDRVLRIVLLYEPLLALAMIVPFKFTSPEGEMAAIVNEGTRLTAAECGAAQVLFTDGALDAAVESAAAIQGKKLKAISMMSGSKPYEMYLRTRDAADEEDRGMLAVGAANALRTWVRSKPECATNIALQLGFELWRHDKLPMPQCGGLVARTAGFAPGVAEKEREAALALAERILALYADKEPMEIVNHGLKSMFVFLQWRIARMCRMRADAADRAADMKRAMGESELADALDAKNVAYARIRKQMDWVGQQKGMRLTPREGLKIGLDRADFRLARTFAQQVLVSDPENTRANFAMGMGYFVDEQYGRAEVYLKRALARSPNEPAALNNLAIAQLRLGKLAEAETNATKALKAYPTSKEIKKTYDHIKGLQKK
jgi:tetratricopeptide (TPR) repeat protein